VGYTERNEETTQWHGNTSDIKANFSY
jgi:hypothetical protein